MKRNSFHLQINLYKESKDFPLSGVDMPIYYEERTIKRILEVLKPLIKKTTNVVINSSQITQRVGSTVYSNKSHH